MSDQVTHNRTAQRYELHVDGELAGFVQYRIEDGTVVLVHTEVDPGFEGRGLGSTLVRATLDDARANGRSVLPLCSFIARYVRRHPEYVDLVVPDRRAEFRS
ncbi:N-acetyltransferase [Carbonactinospora thermoautotrophica]|uniref:GNAT family N-acetyltransferase n=1 Tax=Carbonactinospora thermoautotrophica TaxID=1469144 RepID=UPI00082FA85C|nr:GNAT family N-acetyltransferase [Carbonactinospora thermoautotrophica]MCX9192087.1 N-acetyltransferase [Carbonactinospora thermoautotrophica]